MRKYTLFIIFLICYFPTFSQENVLESKHTSLILTEKEFFDNSISIDTIIRQTFFVNGVSSKKEGISYSFRSM
jgi:hypothetical protein